MEKTFVSIIVPTYKDWKRLALCVEALSKQTYQNECFEVIIVNNDSGDVMPSDFLLPHNFKLITEAKPGSYAARNAALKIAKGEIIGFTDSDCIPEKDWIKSAVDYLNDNKNCSRIAGQVLVFSDAARTTVSEKYDMIYAFPQQLYVEKGKSSVTANLFTYKAIFDAIGFFNETLLSNGDLEWGRSAQQAGYPVHFVKDVVVKHPARSLTELIKKAKRIGGGRGMAERQWNNKLSNLFNLINGCRPRLAEIRYIYTNATYLPAMDKIKVLFLRHYLLQVSAMERLVVQLGKQPKRA